MPRSRFRTLFLLSVALAGSTTAAQAQNHSFTLWNLQSNSFTVAATEPGTIWVLASWAGQAQRAGIGRTEMVAATLPLSVTLAGPSLPSSAPNGTPADRTPLVMTSCSAEERRTPGHACYDSGSQSYTQQSAQTSGGSSESNTRFRTRRAISSQPGEMLREIVTAADVAAGTRWTVSIFNPTTTTSLLTGRVCVRFVRAGGPPPPACS